MSAFSKNPFDLLGDDSEDVEVLQEQAPKTEAKPQEKSKKPADKSRAHRGEARIRHEYPQRGGLKTIASTRSGADEPRAPRDRVVAPRFQRSGEEGTDFPARPPRGEGRSRGSNERGRGGYRGRGRQYDRHSGTGRVDGEKKETMGWGDATNSWEEGPKTVEAELAVDAAETPNATAEEKPAEAVATEAAAPALEEQVKTLDEYLVEKAQKTLNITLPEARKANEGADDAKWKGAVELEKGEEEEALFAGKEQNFRTKNKAKKEKVFVEIEQRFPGGRPARGGRGGFERRGGYRGGAERGERRDGFRSPRPTNGVNVDDEGAFPTLGSK